MNNKERGVEYERIKKKTSNYWHGKLFRVRKREKTSVGMECPLGSNRVDRT